MTAQDGEGGRGHRDRPQLAQEQLGRGGQTAGHGQGRGQATRQGAQQPAPGVR
ncbi:hypothetical protein JOF53_008404 [Crossiella equi]|uniref:Uncharacterized protein n=1 Tax=Crossiella equi TaxID=130796 RepID=A0ABS5AT01_9PSEU|nr:hypothetical protein [Crossiella equi]MBP2479532.1 hypothetical protein [Crossiella equi]